MNRWTTLLAASALVPATAAHAQLHETDFGLEVIDNQLMATAVDQGGQTTESRVKSGVFGELPALPNWTDDPGFDSQTGTFDVGRWIGFDFAGPVLTWDGSAFDLVSEFPIRITEDSTSAVSSVTPGVVAGFEFAQANSSGRIHEHVAFEIQPSVNDGRNPEDGLYLLELELWSVTPPELIASDSLFIVFGRGQDPVAIDDAIAWVDANLANDCLADLSGDGIANGLDVGLFLQLYAADDPGADLSGDGNVNGLDVGLFLQAYAAGC